MNKTTLYLSPETQRNLRDLAKRTGRHQADVIRQALGQYLQQHGQRPPLRSIGSGEDGELAARDSEDRLNARWGQRLITLDTSGLLALLNLLSIRIMRVYVPPLTQTVGLISC